VPLLVSWMQAPSVGAPASAGHCTPSSAKVQNGRQSPYAHVRPGAQFVMLEQIAPVFSVPAATQLAAGDEKSHFCPAVHPH
jgi:hypothetical protein